MLSFAAEFPIAREHRSKDFIGAIRKWILGSPHTKLVPQDLEAIPETGDWSLTKEGERVQTLFVAADGEESAAVSWSTTDGNLEWETAVVFSRGETDSWVGVRTSRESLHPAIRLPPARKPFIVRTLLSSLGGAKDGDLNVTDLPLRLTNNDIDLAARLIKGTSGCRLPVVYISCGFAGDYILDADRLAKLLSGIAHVVVEPNRPFSRRLQLSVDSENVYGGRVGIYWPEGAGRRSFFIGPEYENPTEIAFAIMDEIRVALTNRRPLVRCTWAAVQALASKEALRVLRSSGSNEVEKYVHAFDAEMKAKNEQLADAEKEISRLGAEIRKYEAQTAIGAGVSIRTGAEHDLYPGEMMNIVRDAVQEALARQDADTRRAHVLSAILHNLPASSHPKDQREQIKEMLRDYRSLDGKTRKALEAMGFTIDDDGKHHKLVFQGDGRYTFVLSKTSSDHRAGLNVAGAIGRTLF